MTILTAFGRQAFCRHLQLKNSQYGFYVPYGDAIFESDARRFLTSAGKNS
jgi:hypothetical protein